MVNEFKLTVVHFVRPNTMQICACTWINHWTKTVKNQDSRLSWAVGRRPLDLWATGPWASDLPATGLPLAKPSIQIFILIGGEHVTCPESKLTNFPGPTKLNNSLEKQQQYLKFRLTHDQVALIESSANLFYQPTSSKKGLRETKLTVSLGASL